MLCAQYGSPTRNIAYNLYGSTRAEHGVTELGWSGGICEVRPPSRLVLPCRAPALSVRCWSMREHWIGGRSQCLSVLVRSIALSYVKDYAPKDPDSGSESATSPPCRRKPYASIPSKSQPSSYVWYMIWIGICLVYDMGCGQNVDSVSVYSIRMWSLPILAVISKALQRRRSPILRRPRRQPVSRAYAGYGIWQC